MKYIKLLENFDSYDPYELMIIPPNKKAEMIVDECKKDEPNLNLVSDLIVLGANLDWQDEDNYNFTALHRAAGYGRVEIARMLIDAGANLNVQNTWGNTPLRMGAGNGRVEIVRMLIDAGANVDAQDKWGKTSLNVVTYYGNAEIARMLIDAKANVNMQNEWDVTPLHDAAEFGRVEIAQMLIDAGARKDIPDNRGRLPYDLAETEELKNLLKP